MSDLFGCSCPHCGQPMPEFEEGTFSLFWEKVPHKVGKADARKAWLKLKSPERHAAKQSVAAFYAWFKREYPTASAIHPATYLNARRWEDEAFNPASNGVDVLQYWARQIKGNEKLWSKPSRDLISQLLAAGW